MASYIENFGLSFLTETDEDAIGLVQYIAKTGKAIVGYYGTPYINAHFGDAQFILRTELKSEEKAIEVVGMDTHCSGECVWECRLGSVELNTEEEDKLSKKCILAKKEDGSGMVVANIVNADVLPSFQEDDIVKLQMVAFSVDINYYPDEDAYAKEQPESASGRKWLLADGTIFPSGLLRNRNPEDPEYGKNNWMDDHVLIRGTVKKLCRGDVRVGETEAPAFIRCVIDTQNGPLELIHTAAQVKRSQHDYVKIGAVVSGIFVLSGDAAIYEYENGIVKDEEHDLALLRGIFCGEDPERMRYALAEDAVYIPGSGRTLFKGRDAILAQMGADRYNGKVAYMATIESVDDGDTSLSYERGKRCVVIVEEATGDYQSFVFVETDQEGRIASLSMTAENRYHVRLDPRPEKKAPLEGMRGPKDFRQAMVWRARFHDMVDDGIDTEEKLPATEHASEYVVNALRTISYMPKIPAQWADNMKKTFGYLFTKSAEQAFVEKRTWRLLRRNTLTVFEPAEIWAGKITVTEKFQKLAKRCMEIGTQFYKDFQPNAPGPEDDIDEWVDALVLVQRIGELYAKRKDFTLG